MEAAVHVLEAGQLGEDGGAVPAEEVVSAEGLVEGEGARQHEGDGTVTAVGCQLPVGHQNKYSSGGNGRRRW